MFKELFLVLKKDLAFHFTDEEKLLVDKMTDKDFQNFRMMLLEKIKICEFPIDVLEDYLECEKENEKIARFRDLKTDDVEAMASIDAELDKTCSKLLIGIIKGNANELNLLPSDEEEIELAMAK